MSLFVIYGFDTAPRSRRRPPTPARTAPKAVSTAVIGAFIIGDVFLRWACWWRSATSG